MYVVGFWCGVVDAGGVVGVSIAIRVWALCDKGSCEERYEADSTSETMALREAREEGWKVDLGTQKARCPKHKDSGGTGRVGASG